MTKSQNFKSIAKIGKDQNDYQLLTKSQKIKLTNVINKKQFQNLIHDEKKNKQKMVGTIRKQKEQFDS